jgi:hypothetical protein
VSKKESKVSKLEVSLEDVPEPPSVDDIQEKGWMYYANCKKQTEKMFPKGHKDISYILDARALCSGCFVREQCLDYALEFPVADMHGIWAGMTSRQLAAEQRRRGITAIRPTLSQMWGDKNR